MSVENVVFDLHKNPPVLYGEQLNKQVYRLDRLRAVLQRSPFLRQRDVKAVMDMLNKHNYTHLTLPEISAAAVEFQLGSFLEFPQDVNWNLGTFIANKSALRGGSSLLSDIFSTAQELKFPSGKTLSGGEIENIQILNADPTGIELAQHLKGVYDESYFYNSPHSILNIPCLVVGSSMAADLYTVFAENHRRSFGI